MWRAAPGICGAFVRPPARGLVLRGTAGAPAGAAGTARAHRLGSSCGAAGSCKEQGQHPRRMCAGTLRAGSHSVGSFNLAQLLKFHGTRRAEVLVDWHVQIVALAARRNGLD